MKYVVGRIMPPPKCPYSSPIICKTLLYASKEIMQPLLWLWNVRQDYPCYPGGYNLITLVPKNRTFPWCREPEGEQHEEGSKLCCGFWRRRKGHHKVQAVYRSWRRQGDLFSWTALRKECSPTKSVLAGWLLEL